MKRKSPTPWLPFSSRLLLRPLTDISSATWDLDPFSLYKRHYLLWMKIYPYMSYRRQNKRNRRKFNVQFAESMGQLWLAEWK